MVYTTGNEKIITLVFTCTSNFYWNAQEITAVN
jgi:hypothetical protein